MEPDAVRRHDSLYQINSTFTHVTAVIQRFARDTTEAMQMMEDLERIQGKLIQNAKQL